MSHTGHGRTVCTCGNVIMQCRCPGNGEVLETVPGGCEECKKAGRVIPLDATVVPIKPSLFTPPAPEDCPACAKVKRHPGEGYACAWHDPMVPPMPVVPPAPVLDQLAKDDPLFDADMVTVHDDRRMLAGVRRALEGIAHPDEIKAFDGAKVVTFKVGPLELARAARVVVSAGKLLDDREDSLRMRARGRQHLKRLEAEAKAGPGPVHQKGRND